MCCSSFFFFFFFKSLHQMDTLMDTLLGNRRRDWEQQDQHEYIFFNIFAEKNHCSPCLCLLIASGCVSAFTLYPDWNVRQVWLLKEQQSREGWNLGWSNTRGQCTASVPDKTKGIKKKTLVVQKCSQKLTCKDASALKKTWKVITALDVENKICRKWMWKNLGDTNEWNLN